MQDAFQLLGLPRRPWLDPDTVRSAFHEVSQRYHPDRMAGRSEEDRRSAEALYADLVEANRWVSDVRLRLRHLLAMERGVPPEEVSRVPPQISDLFFEVNRVIRPAEMLRRQPADDLSAMQKVERMQAAAEHIGRLKTVQAELETRCRRLEEELKALNEFWESDGVGSSPDRKPLGRLESIYLDYGYLAKWLAQVRELQFQLLS